MLDSRASFETFSDQELDFFDPPEFAPDEAAIPVLTAVEIRRFRGACASKYSARARSPPLWSVPTTGREQQRITAVLGSDAPLAR